VKILIAREGIWSRDRGMRVRVKYFAGIRELMGVGEEEYDFDREITLRELLTSHIPGRHRDVSAAWMEKISSFLKGEPSSYIIIVNGDRRGLDEELRDGDVVAVLPPIGGG